MAITFDKKEKKQKYLLLVFGAVVLITLIVLWQGFFKKEEPAPPVASSPSLKEVRIDFDLLKDPIFGELQPFEEISPLEPGKAEGRENPFLPY